MPAVKIASGILGNKLSKGQLVETALDAVTMLASTNLQLDQRRRELLKPGLQTRYQSIVKMENDDRSPWPFGDNLQNKVNSATAGGKVTKRGGFGGYRGRGCANAHPYGYNPYPMAMCPLLPGAKPLWRRGQ